MYRLPAGGMDVIVYTGFGLEGRDVVNVRSADIVVLIGVLEGSGGQDIWNDLNGFQYWLRSARCDTSNLMLYFHGFHSRVL